MDARAVDHSYKIHRRTITHFELRSTYHHEEAVDDVIAIGVVDDRDVEVVDLVKLASHTDI